MGFDGSMLKSTRGQACGEMGSFEENSLVSCDTHQAALLQPVLL